MIKISTFIMALIAYGVSYAQITVSSSTVTDPTCSGSCNGSILVTPVGGVIPYTYVWQDALGAIIGGNSSTINNLCAGDYSVTISDASSGGGSTTIYSEDFETGASSWTLSNVVAPQGADPNFFTVSDNEGGVAPGGCGLACNGDNTLHITSVFNPAGGAAYDAGGLCGFLFCPETHVRAQSGLINTSGYTNLTLSFDYTADGTITITANGGSGALEYSIDGVTFQPSNTFNAVLPGNYTVTVQDANGCQTTAPTTVSTVNGPSITNVATVDPSCNQTDGSIDITANSPNGGLQYSIDNGATFVAGNIFTLLAAGTYPIVVQDASGCQITSSATLSPANIPAVNAGPDYAICAGSSTVLSATLLTANPAAISWDNGVQQNVSFTPLVTTTYTVTATETSSGCSATDQITVTVDPIPVIDITVNPTS